MSTSLRRALRFISEPGVAYDTAADVRRAWVFGAVMFAGGIFLGLCIGGWWFS